MDLRILPAIKKYASKNPVRLHMPGHKGKKSFSKIFPSASLDVTELDVIENDKVLRLAEEDVAKIMGVKHSIFLTGGATSGIISMVLAVKDLGKKIIINRGAHKSVYCAIEKFDLEPVFVEDLPSVDEISRVCNCDDVIGALLTYPDYYGNTFDIRAIKKVLEKNKKLLLIDNAHGGHFNFIDGLVYAGEVSDAHVDGLHKTFCTLNQGALLCINNDNLFEKVKDASDFILTTSPSYVLLSSIEYGVKFMDAWKDSKESLRFFDDLHNLEKNLALNEIPTLISDDPFKMQIDLVGLNIDPYEAQKVIEKAGVFCEMNDNNSLLFMFSPLTSKKDFNRLYKALIEVKKTCKRNHYNFQFTPQIKAKTEIGYLEARKSEYYTVDLSDAIGLVAHENVGLFPPCMPVVVAGEKFTKETVDCLRKGKNLFGVDNGKVKVCKR